MMIDYIMVEICSGVLEGSSALAFLAVVVVLTCDAGVRSRLGLVAYSGR